MLGLHKKKAWFGHEGTGLTRAFFISEIRAWCAWSIGHIVESVYCNYRAG